ALLVVGRPLGEVAEADRGARLLERAVERARARHRGLEHRAAPAAVAGQAVRVTEREQRREAPLRVDGLAVLERRDRLAPVHGGLLVREQARGALGRPLRAGE